MNVSPVLGFKLAQTVIIVLYVAIGSDFARRPKTKALISPVLSMLMQWVYLGLVAVYLYVLYTLSSLVTWDYLALAFTLGGTLVYIRAKRDLAQRFTYVGFAFENITIMKNGIYGYIRHPIYTGSYLFTIGALCTAVPRISQFPTALSVIGLAGVLYIYAFFIPTLASRESRNMLDQHGEAFEEYRRRVHAFLPFPGVDSSSRP